MGPRSRICTLTGRALAAAAQAMGCPFRPAKDPRLRQLPLSDPQTVSWGTHPIHLTPTHLVNRYTRRRDPPTSCAPSASMRLR
jgi:hypothetical protein